MRLPIPLLLALAACAAPDLPVPRSDPASPAAWPELLPLTDALGPERPSRISAATAPRLEARAERLRARAAALRQSALTEAERRRIREGLRRLRPDP